MAIDKGESEQIKLSTQPPQWIENGEGTNSIIHVSALSVCLSLCVMGVEA